MSPVEWYYARGNKQMGPVPSGELKRLAAVDGLRPEDLVWREGMAEWSPARNVRGLFDDESRAAAIADMLSSSPPVSPSSIGQSAASATGTTAKFIGSHAARTPRRHFFDVLLDGLLARFDAAFVEKTARVFRTCGSYGLFLAMVVVAAFTVIAATKSRSLNEIPSGVVLLFVLAVLQWAAGKFCDVLEQLNRTTGSSLSSTAFPDFCALLSLAVGLAGLIGSAIAAVAMGMHSPTLLGILSAAAVFLLGLLAFAICGYLAVVAVNLPALNISIDPEARAGEEAIGVSAFVLKALLRLVPVWFGAGVVCGTILMGYACCLAFFVEEGLGGMLLEMAAGAAIRPVLIGFAALPVVAYLTFVFYCLVIEVLRAFLILPGKIDKLAQKDEEPKSGQP